MIRATGIGPGKWCQGPIGHYGVSIGVCAQGGVEDVCWTLVQSVHHLYNVHAYMLPSCPSRSVPVVHTGVTPFAFGSCPPMALRMGSVHATMPAGRRILLHACMQH